MTVLALVLAAAGGGSSGFGGGGGGGGGGGFSGGGGSCCYGGGGGSISGGALAAIIVVVLLIVIASAIMARLAVRRYRKKREARVAQVRLASNEAADDDAYFAADVVEAEGRDLFVAVQGAWDGRDLDTLARLAGPDLMVEWRRRLDDFARKGWHNRVVIRSGPLVEYVGLVNRDDDTEDRVVLRMEAQLDDWVVTAHGQDVFYDGQTSAATTLAEYWTLARTGDSDGDGAGRWMLLSIEQKAEGDHQLDAAIIASPWGDTARIGGEATLEVAAADTPLPGYTTADLVSPDFAADARAAAADLAIADARFGADVISACVSRAVEAWVEAVDGPDDALIALATPEAVRALLHPGDDRTDPSTRLVVRGVHVEQIAVQAITPSPEPARITVAVTARGRRYVEDRDTVELLSGSKDREKTFTDFWVLALTGDATMPWRLVGAA